MLLSLKCLARCAVGACLLASLPSAALAQAVIMERQLSFDAARTMATAALETCRKNGYRVSVTVVKDALGLPGGLPIKVGNETIGGVGVAGAPGGNGDVACAEAAIEAIKEQLK